MIVYRIAKRKRALDISGTGAAINPGRWNRQGTPVLYTSESREMALLENIVNLPPMIAPQWDIMTLELPDGPLFELKVDELAVTWNRIPAPAKLPEIGQKRVGKGETLGRRVPSRNLQQANHILLNCEHVGYDQVKILDHRAFYFDSRL